MTTETTTTPGAQAGHAVLQELLEGNACFARGEPRHLNRGLSRVAQVAPAQSPTTMVIGCADSRVTAELLFDTGVGELFNQRLAGGVITGAVLGGLEYCSATFGSPLLLVLGHSSCGAISAAVDVLVGGARADGHLHELIDPIISAIAPSVAPLVGKAPRDEIIAAAVDAKIRSSVEFVLRGSALLAARHAAGELLVAGARYDLAAARVTVLQTK